MSDETKEQKPLCGFVKEIDGKYGKIIRISFHEGNIADLQKNLNKKGWVDVDIKVSKQGKPYAELQPPYEGGTGENGE